MTQPSPPTAAARKWLIATIALGIATAISTAVYLTDLLDSNVTTWLAPRIWQLAIYLLAVATAAVSGRYTVELAKAHIDRQVVEATDRVDQRVTAIARCIGARLDENTGEIKRVQADVELDGYAKGYADGLARAPITGVAKVARITPR